MNFPSPHDLAIHRYPDPILTTRCPEIENAADPAVQARIGPLIDRMFELMGNLRGVGLAANQAGWLGRCLILDIPEFLDGGDEDDEDDDEFARRPRKRNPLVLINPVIVERDGSMVGNEGCLSFPEIFATVRRARHIVVNALDRHGKPITIEADNNLLSRALQHEIDHLDGKLFIEKFSPTDKFTRRHRLRELEEAYEAHLASGG